MMEYHMNKNVSTVFGLLLICVCISGVWLKADRHFRSCQNVKNEFRKLGNGDVGMVPSKPTRVDELAVCGRTLTSTNQEVCCVDDMIPTYEETAKQYLKNNLHSGTAFLKKFLNLKLQEYEDIVQLLLEGAQNRTSILLTQMHNIPWTKHHDAVKSFFQHLQKYIVGEENELHKSVQSFFSKLFPSVFYYTLNDPSFLQMDDKYHECLSKHANVIKPFGKVPHELEKKLQHSLHRSRAFVNLLTNIVEVMKTSDHMQVEKDCIDAVTRLNYCSHCHGYTDVKPCRGFCLNVMRGCLANLSDISPAWDSLVSSFGNLASDMKNRNSLKTVLLSVDRSVFDGILEAMQGGPRIHASVLRYCVKSTDVTANQKFDGKIDTSLMMATNTDLSDISIEELIDSVSKRLHDSLGMYNRIADGICSNPSVFSDTMTATHCWNGTHIGQYLADVPEVNIVSQAKSNKEVKVIVNGQLSLNTIKNRLTHMRANVTSMLSDYILQGDDPSVNNDDNSKSIVYSSGTLYISDDEDLNQGGSSGSGSGDDISHTKDENPVITRIDKKKDKDVNTATSISSSILITYLFLFLSLYIIK